MKPQELQFLGQCPVCNNKYSPSGASILNRRADTALVHVDCLKCQSSVLVAVMSNILGIVTTVGMLTDMSKDDVMRFQNEKPITTNDILELHLFLEKKNRK